MLIGWSAMENPLDTPQDMSQRLVSCDWLAAHLDDPGIRIIEVSSTADDTEYRQGHIPGAVWWFWKDALWHATDREFPTPEDMARRLGRIGVTPDTTVVVYGNPVQFGTYAFWVLSMAGHRDVRLLDGGRKRWIADGRPLSAEIPAYAPVHYPAASANLASRVGRDDVRARLGQVGRLLLDVRSPEEYRGERVSPPPGFDHGAERKGHIPGAVHLYFRDILHDDDTFKTTAQMLSRLARVGLRPDSPEEIVTYCRLSHRATLVWFALAYLLGFSHVKVYDGSWTEWGSLVGFPIAKS
jgi:thiosulfate/3-mercaptopyruvate sulfurtransferase